MARVSGRRDYSAGVAKRMLSEKECDEFCRTRLISKSGEMPKHVQLICELKRIDPNLLNDSLTISAMQKYKAQGNPRDLAASEFY